MLICSESLLISSVLLRLVASWSHLIPRGGSLLSKRQQNVDSVCNAYGIDFQNGGSYFINSLSDADFTCVTKFEGCSDDAASILLVNNKTSDQYKCSSVHTMPDDTPEMSTCPVRKSQMSTGNWAVLLLGNNRIGKPFAWQRSFNISVGPQQTVTTTPTVTGTLTSYPTTFINAVSTEIQTITVSNRRTITAGTETIVDTVTAKPTIRTIGKTKTRTFHRWTKTESAATIIVTPSCTIPPRPRLPDPICHIRPTLIPLPKRVSVPQSYNDPATGVDSVQKRFDKYQTSDAHTKAEVEMKKRDADEPTITVTASTAITSIVTVTAPVYTETRCMKVVSIFRTTLPGTTVTGKEVCTTTVPGITSTVYTRTHTWTYATETISILWTYTSTTTPAASASACTREGGHFCNDLALFNLSQPSHEGFAG